jgi:hypothetical protein
MSLPAVTISKNVNSTSQAPASTTGILAIIAASSSGVANTPGGYSRSDLAITDYGYGPLTDFAAYELAVANQPCLLMKSAPTVLGSYGTITTSASFGTSVVTATASTHPFDTYAVVVTFVNGGTQGITGITYTYSLDGGNVVSGVVALGTATVIAIPNTGCSFDLGAGTLVAGTSFTCYTERPMMNDADILVSLQALANTRLPWEGVLLDCLPTSSTVGEIDVFLSGLEAKGIFKFALINTRYKLTPEPTAESEATYAAALNTMFGTSTSIRQCVGADGAHVPSQITGWNLKRPTSLLLAARAMSTQIGVDPAYVALGPLPGAAISDTKGNPFDHDEDLYPNLDALRFTSLRSFAPGGPQGTYICNANTIQASGGAFPYLQHIRIMNRACEIAWFALTTQLSRGVRKNPKADPVTGAVTIFEPDAAIIEGIVNDALAGPMKGQVNAIQFSISRTDDLNAVPCVVTGVLSIVAFAYIKGVKVVASFTKTLQSAL